MAQLQFFACFLFHERINKRTVADSHVDEHARLPLEGEHHQLPQVEALKKHPGKCHRLEVFEQEVEELAHVFLCGVSALETRTQMTCGAVDGIGRFAVRLNACAVDREIHVENQSDDDHSKNGDA